MSTTYNGNPENISGISEFQALGFIASSTNASPIVLTFASDLPDWAQTDDVIYVNGHQVNTAANGIWQIEVLSSTTVALIGSTGNGVGGATGEAVDLLAGPPYAIPSDGDPEWAASVNVALEALGDRTALLAYGTGNVSIAGQQPIASSSWQADTAACSTNVWNHAAPGTANTWVGPGTTAWTIDCAENDVIDVCLTATLENVSGTHNHAACLFAGFAAPGGAPTLAKLQGSQQLVSAQAAGVFAPLCLRGQIVATGTGTMSLAVYLASSGTGDTINLVGDYQMIVNVYRPTLRLSAL